MQEIQFQNDVFKSPAICLRLIVIKYIVNLVCCTWSKHLKWKGYLSYKKVRGYKIIKVQKPCEDLLVAVTTSVTNFSSFSYYSFYASAFKHQRHFVHLMVCLSFCLSVRPTITVTLVTGWSTATFTDCMLNSFSPRHNEGILVSLHPSVRLSVRFAIISNGFTSPFGKKEKKNCHLYNTILSLYISYQDITRRVC